MNLQRRICRGGLTLLVLAALGSCASNDSARVSGSVSVGAGYNDPWYHGHGYYPHYPPVVVAPPPIAVRPPGSVRPPSLPSTPRPMPMPRGRR